MINSDVFYSSLILSHNLWHLCDSPAVESEDKSKILLSLVNLTTTLLLVSHVCLIARMVIIFLSRSSTSIQSMIAKLRMEHTSTKEMNFKLWLKLTSRYLAEAKSEVLAVGACFPILLTIMGLPPSATTKMSVFSLLSSVETILSASIFRQ